MTESRHRPNDTGLGIQESGPAGGESGSSGDKEGESAHAAEQHEAGKVAATSPIVSDGSNVRVEREGKGHRHSLSLETCVSSHLDGETTQQPGASPWSHQQIVAQPESEEPSQEDVERAEKWQDMPAIAQFDIYDEETGKIIARARSKSLEGDEMADSSLGYTRVTTDDDAQSATSMDEETRYLFSEEQLDDDAARTPLSQMQATKEFLTEAQKVAYIALCKLAMMDMIKDTSRAKTKEVRFATESMVLWSQKMMMRLYSHMDITPQGDLSKEVANFRASHG